MRFIRQRFQHCKLHNNMLKFSNMIALYESMYNMKAAFQRASIMKRQTAFWKDYGKTWKNPPQLTLTDPPDETVSGNGGGKNVHQKY